MLLKFLFFLKEKQIVSSSWTAKEGFEESPVGENVDSGTESDQQSNSGEDEEAAPDCDGTVSKLVGCINGDIKSGNLLKGLRTGRSVL